MSVSIWVQSVEFTVWEEKLMLLICKLDHVPFETICKIVSKAQI